MRGIPWKYEDEVEILKDVFCNIEGTQITHNGKIKKIYSHPEGYKYVCIKFERKHYMFWVHRVVAIKNLSPPEEQSKIIVCHNGDIKSDNSSKNIRWGTQKENIEEKKEEKKKWKKFIFTKDDIDNIKK